MTARERLPNRRACETFEITAGGLNYRATVGRLDDGRVAEIFLSNHKVGSQADTAAKHPDRPIDGGEKSHRGDRRQESKRPDLHRAAVLSHRRERLPNLGEEAMSDRGFIKLDRAILDDPLMVDPVCFRAWVWLLFEAAWKPRRITVTTGRSKVAIELDRGQLSYSLAYNRRRLEHDHKARPK